MPLFEVGSQIQTAGSLSLSLSLFVCRLTQSKLVKPLLEEDLLREKQGLLGKYLFVVSFPLEKKMITRDTISRKLFQTGDYIVNAATNLFVDFAHRTCFSSSSFLT